MDNIENTYTTLQTIPVQMHNGESANMSYITQDKFELQCNNNSVILPLQTLQIMSNDSCTINEQFENPPNTIMDNANCSDETILTTSAVNDLEAMLIKWELRHLLPILCGN